ncbi:hypothetical protein K474DRAFT_1332718 [Panus rudis PR-1116 ss-1]|nr:hypothetical protein K474DRAFT_1332718 [Panus rudis PR-1116 ss-1]
MSEYDYSRDVPLWAAELATRAGGSWRPIIRRNPQNVTRILKKLSIVERNKPPVQQYFFLIDLFDWVQTGSPKRSQWTAVIASGLFSVLFDVLHNKQTYDATFDYPIVMNQQRFIGVIITVILDLAFKAGGENPDECLNRNTLSERRAYNAFSKALDQLTDLWKLFWDRRSFYLGSPGSPLYTYVLFRPSDMSRSNLFMSGLASAQAKLWNDLYHDYRKRYPDGKYIFRIMFYLWIIYLDDLGSLPHFMEVATSAFTRMRGSEHDEAIRDVINASQLEDGSNQYVITTFFVLVEDDDCVNQVLGHVLGMLMAVMAESQDIFYREEDLDDGVDVYSAVARACQRQICCGFPGFNCSLFSVAETIFTLFLRFPDSPYMAFAQKRMHVHNLIPIVARGALLEMLQKNDKQHIG